MIGYVLGSVSAVVLLVTLGMHLAALGGGRLEMPATVGVVLLAAEFIVLGAFVVSAARQFMREKPTAAGLRDLFPGWVIPLVLVVAMYSFGSFLLHVIGGDGAVAVTEGERHLLMRDGETVAVLSREEFFARSAARARAETAYSLVFLLAPCLWFLTRRRPAATATG